MEEVQCCRTNGDESHANNRLSFCGDISEVNVPARITAARIPIGGVTLLLILPLLVQQHMAFMLPQNGKTE